MPSILYAANTLGEKGRHHYCAVMGATSEIKNEALTNKTARQLLQRFQQGLDSATAGFDFSDWVAKMLRTGRFEMP